jgi:hypothetical protein
MQVTTRPLRRRRSRGRPERAKARADVPVFLDNADKLCLGRHG